MHSPSSYKKWASVSPVSQRGAKTPNRGSMTTMTFLYPNKDFIRFKSPIAIIPKTKKPLDVFKASGTQPDDPSRPITYI